ncbi:MAG: hypothetical protein WKF60_08310, partial [Ilumatobacter sp.]
MPTSRTPSLFVVDGSNIATEGRSKPSLEQLNEAVLAFMEENPDVEITVVVDATFGHRISKKEVKAFDEAVANNELVTPPAGAIGRGDAFVLSIANKAKAGVLSNDSFQEFHGDYEWLFDEGRLVGGKPVPHVGWVWVSRTPVRGPKSRRSVKEAKDADHTEAKETANRRVRKKSAASSVEPPSRDAVADETSPPEEESSGATSKSRSGGRRQGGGRGRGGSDTNGAHVDVVEATPPAGGSKDHVNELMPFIDFVEHHPVGTSCTAEVESYASHGAYARTGDVLIYLPLRLLDDPAPRSARSALTIGDSITVVIVGFTPDRRSIDAALPHMADARVAEAAAPIDAQSLIEVADDEPAPASTDATPARKSTAKKPAKKSTTKQTPAEQSPAKKTAAKKTAAKKTAVKKSASEKTASEKTASEKTASKKTAS